MANETIHVVSESVGDAALESWPLDEAQIIEGSPAASGTLLWKSDDSKLCAGIWECTPGTFDWTRRRRDGLRRLGAGDGHARGRRGARAGPREGRVLPRRDEDALGRPLDAPQGVPPPRARGPAVLHVPGGIPHKFALGLASWRLCHAYEGIARVRDRSRSCDRAGSRRPPRRDGVTTSSALPPALRRLRRIAQLTAGGGVWQAVTSPPEGVDAAPAARDVEQRQSWPIPSGSAGSTTRWSPTGSRPSIVRSRSSGAPVDQACGLQAVGYWTGILRHLAAGSRRTPRAAGRRRTRAASRMPAAIRAASSLNP